MTLAQRHAAAAKYRPSQIRLLLVAEAPPDAEDRYFYYENVTERDDLFRYVWEGLTGEKPDRARKPEHLDALQRAGVFLIDVHENAILKHTAAALRPEIPRLVDRCRALSPRHIALIKVTVYDAAFAPLRHAGLPVIDERIPFPGSGRQPEFLDPFRRVVRVAGLKRIPSPYSVPSMPMRRSTPSS